MLKISKLADYAAVIMHFLARQPELACSATQVAQQVRMPAPTVSKVLKLLLEANLVVSVRGAGGGYKLARSAAKITVAEVIAAIEGKPALTECSLGKNICEQDTGCALKGNWRLINRLVIEALTGLTLQDMAKPLLQQPLLINHLRGKLQLTVQPSLPEASSTLHSK